VNGKQSTRAWCPEIGTRDAATWTCCDYNHALPPPAQLSRGAVSGDMRTLNARATMRTKPHPRDPPTHRSAQPGHRWCAAPPDQLT